MTVRRDLVELERNGLLKRTHGGAMMVRAPSLPIDQVEREFESRVRTNRSAKERIAKAALKLTGLIGPKL